MRVSVVVSRSEAEVDCSWEEASEEGFLASLERSACLQAAREIP